jgi:hypothetical protein
MVCGYFLRYTRFTGYLILFESLTSPIWKIPFKFLDVSLVCPLIVIITITSPKRGERHQ